MDDLDTAILGERHAELAAWNAGDSRTATRHRDNRDLLLDVKLERRTDAVVEQPTP